MKIAVISLGRRGAGGPISLELACHLQSHAEVLAVISSYAEDLARWHASGIPLVETPTYRNFPQAVLSWIMQSRLRSLAGQIREQAPDVLLFPIFHSWSPFIQSRLPEIPAVVVVHDPQPHPGDLEWLLENRSIRQAQRCILFSASLKPYLIQRGIPPEKIDIIPLGPLTHSSGESPRSESGKQSPVILFFGRITRYKGLEVLLQAYRELYTSHPARLVIAGEGDLKPYAQLLADLPQIEIANRWIPDEEVGDFFNRASIVVLPYTSATQSGVLATAASYGRAVVATRTGGIPEQVQDGISGLLVAPDSSDPLREALARLLDDPGLAARLGAELQRQYQSSYSWERSAELAYAACQKAIQSRQHG
jgi:glycosyltransferase involved in cell wall biosynthesis